MRFSDDKAGLSDLFFNYEHPEYDKSPRVGDSASRYDLIKDAAAFRQTLIIALDLMGVPYLPDDVPTAEQFADDFLARP